MKDILSCMTAKLCKQPTIKEALFHPGVDWHPCKQQWLSWSREAIETIENKVKGSKAK